MIYGINLKLIFAGLSGLIGIAAFLPYIRDIFLGKTKPHSYTWLIWALTQATAVAGLWYGNGGWGTPSLLAGTVFVFFVFLLSLKYGTENITKSDTIVLVAAILSIIVWWQLKDPFIAVLMVSIINFLGYLPSFRKTFKNPWSETIVAWAAFSLVSIFSILALDEYNFLTLAYLVSTAFANIILFVICSVRREVVVRK